MSKKIVFFNKNRVTVGGAYYQFMDYALYIAENTNYETYYIDYPHPHLDGKYIESGFTVLDVEKCNYHQFEDAIFIAPVNYVFFLLEEIHELKNAKVCLYFYHPDVLLWLKNQFYLRRVEKGVLEPLYKTLIETKGYVMMDICNQRSAIRLTGLPWEERFFPVTLHQEETYKEDVDLSVSEQNKSNVLRIGWLGKLDSYKIYTVINVADNLMKYTKAERIDFHIIGDGNAKSKLSLTDYSPKIRFIFTSYLYDEIRDAYIRDNIDLMIAMGLSAVDVSMLGIPTVIPVVSPRRFWTDIYVYVHDTKGYALGWEIEDLQNMGCVTHTLEEVIDEVYGGKKNEIGNKQRLFCKEYFALHNSANQLINYLKETTLTVSDLLECSTISRQLDDFALYKRLRPMRDYGSFHQFVIKVNKTRGLKSWKRMQALVEIVEKRKRDQTTNSGKRSWSYYYIKKSFKYLKVYNQYKGKLRRIASQSKEKKCIRVAFIVVFSSVFPTRPVFEEMLRNDHFDPYIIVAPNVERTHDYLLEVYKETIDALKCQYSDRVIDGYNVQYDQYLELKEYYQLVFFNNPYPKLVHAFHRLDYFLDKDVLTVYMNYGFAALAFWNEVLNTEFYNQVWITCLESKMNLRHLRKHQQIFGLNGVVTGYIKMDKMAQIIPRERTRKRILICPHHTVWGWNKLDIGNFLRYADFFLTLPQKYPEIDFVFRPHPLLFKNLANSKTWTQDKIDEYINDIESIQNMSYDTSAEYFDQFVNSDAMIHDCGSFIGEYLFTEKPCCYMLKTPEQAVEGLVPLGQKCMENYYHAFNENDIIHFIDDVVIKGIDPLKTQREQFAQIELKFNYPHSAEKLTELIEKKIFG